MKSINKKLLVLEEETVNAEAVIEQSVKNNDKETFLATVEGVMQDMVVKTEVVKPVEKWAKKRKPFMFSVTEMEDMSDPFYNIVLQKYKLHLVECGGLLERIEPLARGAPLLHWKIAVAVKVAQKQPWILKFTGPETCKLCGDVNAMNAVVEWDDRYYDKVANCFKERKFVISCVCQACLDGCGALYLHHAAMLEIILSKASTAQFEHIHNAKDHVCALCKDHQSDSTMIYIPWNRKLLNVPVCDKHFDLLVGSTKFNGQSPVMDIANTMKADGSLSTELYDVLVNYRPMVQKKKVKTIRPKVNYLELDKDEDKIKDYV